VRNKELKELRELKELKTTEEMLLNYLIHNYTTT